MHAPLSAGFTRLSEKNLIRFLKSNKLFVREVKLCFARVCVPISSLGLICL